jgi:virginiamycin B lyase
MNIREITVADQDAGPYGITTGPDEALRFTLNQVNAVGPITTDGAVTVLTGAGPAR